MTIVSSDKDFLQLVSEDVTVFDPFNMVRQGPNEVFEKYGVSRHPPTPHASLSTYAIAALCALCQALFDYETHPAWLLLCPLQLEPYQLLDYFSMVGDSADNVPGIPGIGPKTAQELLEEFDTFEVSLLTIATRELLALATQL